MGSMLPRTDQWGTTEWGHSFNSCAPDSGPWLRASVHGLFLVHGLELQPTVTGQDPYGLPRGDLTGDDQPGQGCFDLLAYRTVEWPRSEHRIETCPCEL